MATETAHPLDPADDASLRMRLDASERLDAGLRRLALEQLEVAAEGFLLPATDIELAERIHRARKASKRVRALLRLVRDDLGTSVYRNENAVVRDQAKRLSELRIATVMIATLDELAADNPALGAELRPGLLARRDSLMAKFRSDADGRAAALTALACARARIEAWPGFDGGHEKSVALCLVPGLGRTYSRGRRAMKAARNSKTAEDFHDWRKQVNYLRYQIEALRGRLPAGVEALGERLSELSETLGAEHDLVDLGRLIAAEDRPDGAAGSSGRALSALGRRRRSLQLRALRSGKGLYRESPDRLTARLTAHWGS